MTNDKKPTPPEGVFVTKVTKTFGALGADDSVWCLSQRRNASAYPDFKVWSDGSVVSQSPRPLPPAILRYAADLAEYFASRCEQSQQKNKQ